LGLATVYSIVKQSGGSIWVISYPGEAPPSKSIWPRIESGVRTPEEPAPRPLSLHGAETILVVEDQEQLRGMAVRVLP